MAVYLEKGEVAPDELHAPFEKALREGHLVPICFTSARTGAGVRELLDDLRQAAAHARRRQSAARSSRARAQAQRVSRRAGPGQARDRARVQGQRRSVRRQARRVPGAPGHGQARQPALRRRRAQAVQGRPALSCCAARSTCRWTRCVPGDIGAVAKIEEIAFDSVLHDSHDEDHIHLRPLEFPAPIYGLAIEADQARRRAAPVGDSAEARRRRIPACRSSASATTNETVVRGLGELQVRCLLERMASQYKLEVTTHPPRIAYRETITAPAEGHSRHKKQTGGAGQFGEVFLRIEPLPRGSGFRVRRRGQGRRHSRPVHSRRREGRAAGDRARRHRRLSAAGRAGRRCTTARAIRWTRRKWPSSPPAARPSSTRSTRPARSCSSRSSTSRSTCPSTASATSPAISSSKRGQVSGTQPQRSGPGQRHRPGAAVGAERLRLAAEVHHRRPRARTAWSFSHYEQVPPTVQQQLVAQHRAPVHED